MKRALLAAAAVVALMIGANGARADAAYDQWVTEGGLLMREQIHGFYEMLLIAHCDAYHVNQEETYFRKYVETGMLAFHPAYLRNAIARSHLGSEARGYYEQAMRIIMECPH